MFSFLSRKKIIVTHNGKYHPDEVFACATLLVMLERNGLKGMIIRTRDESFIEKADFVCDIGNVYDASRQRFDHHQPEGAGERNGIPYASFGLVWKEYGEQLCGSKSVADQIDLEMVQGIDASDNGIQVYTKQFPNVGVYTFSDIISSFRPSWKESFDVDEAFAKAVTLAKECLSREIVKLRDKQEAVSLVEGYYQQAEDKRLIFLETYVPWSDVITAYPEPLFVISENAKEHNWTLMTVRNPETPFVNRKDLPAPWAGLRNEALAAVTGVPDALFCHKGLWLVTAKTREGIMELAKIALSM
jgi:uncharacterized UPF0160 family protein